MRPSKITFLSLETILSNSPLLSKLMKKKIRQVHLEI
jgi:hypothetical protein